MRIVDVNEFYSPTGGGVRTYLDRKMGIMADLGHELIVIAPGREDRVEDRAGGGRVIYLKSPGMPFDRNYGLFWDAAPITRLLDELQPDVVENCSPWRPAWIVGNWQGNALKSYFMHNDNIDAYAKRWFENVASPDKIERAFSWYVRYIRRILDKFDTVVTNGPALYDRMRRRGLPIDVSMSLGIDRDRFSPDQRDPALRRSLLAQCGMPDHAALLLGIGRHHPEKRWQMVIDAVAAASATRPVALVLVGQGIETPALQRAAAAAGPHVHLIPQIEDRALLARMMASCDAYIHGCEVETFGLVVSEALAAGAPLIVPDEGGAGAVARREFAETYPARDTAGCTAAILRLLARDTATLRTAARHARPGIATDRDHAVRLIDHYDRCLSARDRQFSKSA